MLDDAFLNDDGSSDSVTGIFNQPAMQSAGYDLAEPDPFEVRNVRDGNNRYLLESDLTCDASYLLLTIDGVDRLV